MFIRFDLDLSASLACIIPVHYRDGCDAGSCLKRSLALVDDRDRFSFGLSQNCKYIFIEVKTDILIEVHLY